MDKRSINDISNTNEGNITESTKEVDDMAVLTKPVNKMLVIDKDSSKKFISDFNKSKVTEEFLETCKKAGKLFGDRDSK
ncbi:hypothetical protein [Clostridium sp. HBUAS56010]|uniref:hypothetical protein n=1 Tax=Clostridium sp. HBUAS56010 TaxID=2571127 RepID=UPI0011778A69|nr:hypothetical protein [Clostridium sp. HBUAS56010]